VVLSRRAVVLALVLLGACSESLFGAHRAAQAGGDDGGGGSDGGSVPETCPSGCIADAGADFDGTAGGKGGHWRYLEDHRNSHSWVPMTVGNNELIGAADPANRITQCAPGSTLPACRALPGALLVSTAGAQSVADPAIEFKATTNQVIQLSLRALVPSGAADQTIRLYRNSREDALFTSTATAGLPVADAITLDAMAGDRFLVAVAPSGGGATNVGLQLFVNTTGAQFPSTCQLALPFTNASGANTVTDQCRGAMFTHYAYTYATGTRTPAAVSLNMTGPFLEQGNVVNIKTNEYLQSTLNDTLDWSHDTTVQFWVQFLQPPSDSAWLFSDQDPDVGGGLGIYVSAISGTNLVVTACTDISQGIATFGTQAVTYPGLTSWQFVRVVRSGGSVSICLNGQRVGSLAVNSSISSMLKTFNPPALGIEDSPMPLGGYFDGKLDDVRVIAGALPCN